MTVSSSLSLGPRAFCSGCLLGAMGVLAICVHVYFWSTNLVGQDIYYCWLDGQRLVYGENPYSRILSGNMSENQKYPTYFPGIYLLTAAFQVAGFTNFSSWVSVWRVIVLLTHLAIGGLIYLLL